MNRKGLVLGAVLLASVGAVSAIAAAHGNFGEGRGHHGWRMGGHDMGEGYRHGGKRHGMRHGKKGGMMRLRQRDADNDGAVTLDEFLKRKLERFTELDANGDGVLDGGELTARMQQKAGQRQRMMMAKLDTDGDGKVTKEEFESSARHGRRGMRGGRHGYGGRHGMHHGYDKGERRGEMGEGDGMSGMDGGRGRGMRAERRANRFARMDANGDGVITAEDLQARAGERVGWFEKKRLHVLDKDGDGKVSAEEFTARSRQKFADMDLNGDGKITGSDLPPGMAERWQKSTGAGKPADGEAPATEAPGGKSQQ